MKCRQRGYSSDNPVIPPHAIFVELGCKCSAVRKLGARKGTFENSEILSGMAHTTPHPLAGRWSPVRRCWSAPVCVCQSALMPQRPVSSVYTSLRSVVDSDGPIRISNALWDNFLQSYSLRGCQAAYMLIALTCSRNELQKSL